MSSLTDRIVALLRTEAASAALAEILAEARDELVDVNDACSAAKARTQLEDQTLAAARLEAAIGHLANHLEAARAREAEAARSKLYAEAKVERDALAKQLLEKYPEAAATIASLLMQIAAVDQKVAAANQDLPEGASYLELVALMTQVPGGWDLANGVRLPSIEAVGLPDHIRTHPGQQYFWAAGRQ